ncbi:mandelate racemase/muconate lactonizing enzyme family protein [Salinifilum ghardaiensis]
MKITEIEAIPFAIPYVKPLRFASGAVHRAEHVLVRVHTDEGITGVAEAPPRPFTYGETQESVIAAVRRLFAPELLGLSPWEREVARSRMHRTVGNPTAKAAIDMAMWDVIGKVAGVPVTDLLGGYADSVRVSHMVGFDDAEKMVAEAERVRDTYGITTFKVKVGRRPYTVDVEACRVLRERLGDGVELYVDGNRGWTASESARALQAMQDLDLTLAEELCPADDVLGRRWLVQRCPLPFVADESATHTGEVTRELLSGSANAISIKTARTGFSDSQRVLHECDGLGVEVLMGNQVDGQIGTMCTAAFGAAHESTASRAGELSNFLDMSDDLLTEPVSITDGTVRVRRGPGIGIDIDPEKLARYRQD